MSVIPFPPRADVMTLWSRYASLVNELVANPALSQDRYHTDARLRAHQRFTQAFVQERL